MKRKSIIINAAVALIVTVLAIIYLVNSGLINKENLTLLPAYSFFAALLFFVLGETIISLVDYFIYRTVTPDMTFFKCVKNTFFGHLGSSVTPYRIGHFPLMAYYQKKDGINLSDTLTAFIKCQIIYSVTSIIVYAAAVIILAALGLKINFNGTEVMLWGVMSLGLLFHVAVFTANILLAFIKPLQTTVLNICAKIIGKFKKSFDKQAFIEQKEQKLKVFRLQIAEIGKKLDYFLIPAFIYVIYMFVSGGTQYVCYLLVSGDTFGIENFMLFYFLYLSSQYITNIVPVPGGAGASELIFTYTFTSVIATNILGSVLVLWRSATFYFAVILEVIAFFALSVFWSIKEKKSERIQTEKEK